MAAVRYVIKARPRGFTEGLDPSTLLASGKLTSTVGVLSTIISVPPAPKNTDLYLEVDSRFIDDVAKTGAGHAYITIWNADETPGFTASNVASEVPPRYVMSPPRADALRSSLYLTVKPGQKFAILETGWAV